MKDQLAIGNGTGFFVSPDGLIVTARHLVTGSTRMGGVTSDGRAFKVLGVVGEDPVHDLVLLKTDAGKVPFLHLGSFAKIKVAQGVSIIGDEHGFKGRVTKGVVAMVENLADDYRWLLLDATVVEGNSGSPVVNDAGEVIGMIRAQLKSYTQGFAVPSDRIKQLLNAAKDAEPAKISDLKKRIYDELFDNMDFKAALAAARRRDNVEAVKKMVLASQHFPESGACLVLIGSYHSNLKAWKDAESAYRAAIKLKPDYALAWAFLGAVLEFQGKRNEGIIACRKAIALKPEVPEGWANLGGIFLASGNYDGVLEVIKSLQGLKTREADNYAANLTKALEKAKSSQGRITP